METHRHTTSAVKYIVLQGDGRNRKYLFTFSSDIIHSEFAYEMKKHLSEEIGIECTVISGGFIVNKDGTLATVGRSISLRVDSKEEDIQLLYSCNDRY
jgi:hypothetical protein